MANIMEYIPGLEYALMQRGGVWYYTQNRPGTTWFDTVNNSKGWTIDFNLKVLNVDNSDIALSNDSDKGSGVYVNDGTRKEVLTFLTQEVIFNYANERVIFDTTAETDYRLIGKEDQLRLFAKKQTQVDYLLIADVSLLESASEEANGLRPKVAEDKYGNFHAVWYDDGNKVGKIYYSFYENGTWSDPYIVVDDDVGAESPDIIVDDENNIYVAYESKIADHTIAKVIYRGELGWSKPYDISLASGDSRYPRLDFDSQYNLFIVWEDHRDKQPNIYIRKFIRNTWKWENEEKLVSSSYGAYRPSISSYMDSLFISWTIKDGGVDDNSAIQVIKYDSILAEYSVIVTVSDTARGDYSNILVNSAGNVFVVWHDNVSGRYEIYASVLNTSLNFLTKEKFDPYNAENINQERFFRNINVTDSRGAAKYPVLSEQLNTGDIYIAWQDYKSGHYREFIPLVPDREIVDPYTDKITTILGSETDPYFQTPYQLSPPVDTTIYVALFESLTRTFLSSGNNSFDVKLIFNDQRSGSIPATPSFFSSTLPIFYESLMAETDGFLDIPGSFTQVACAFYDLSRQEETFLVSRDYNDPYGINRDFLLTGKESRKEIRFGDFSDTLNIHYVFKDFKYYTKDAVIPFKINNVYANNFAIEALNAHDAVISNYGDVWLVGSCGIRFYVDSSNRLIIVGSESDVSSHHAHVVGPTGNIKSIAFDINNYMFVGKKDGGIYYSIGHVDEFVELTGVSNILDVTSLSFDKDNKFFVGTSTGLQIYKISQTIDRDEHGGSTIITLSAEKYSDIENQPTEYISSIKIDDNNVVWIGTWNGLYRYYKDRFLKFTFTNGLPSNHVNDITIRNTAIRYIATSNGIGKMIGSGFDDVIKSEQDNIWNNNVKCVHWQDPNILWAGTLSKVNQIIVDDIEASYSTSIYDLNSSDVIVNDDLRTFYIVSDTSVNENDIIEIYINGNLISDGYDFGYDRDIGQKIIRFKTQLLNDDIVEVLLRKDLTLRHSFAQTTDEKIGLGEKTIRIRDIGVDPEAVGSNDIMYVVTYGDENEVKVNDTIKHLPFDKIHLDTTPPYFMDVTNKGIHIGDQVDKGIVEVSITGATDGEYGSGLNSMIVSNYPNFSVEGETSQSSVPFSTLFDHDLNLSFNNVSTEKTLGNGAGTFIIYIPEDRAFYAGVSQPAIIYRRAVESEEWKEVLTHGVDEFVDFIISYNNKIIISIGDLHLPSRLYVYDSIESGGFFSKLQLNKVVPIAESRSFCYQEYNNKLYVGAGPGLGDEYSAGAGDHGGVLYSFDGSLLETVATNMGDNVYDITEVEGKSTILAATGESGLVYEVDIINNRGFAIHNDNESLISIEYISHNDKDLIFTGGSKNGIVRRSLVDSSSYDVSFRTIPTRVSAIQVYTDVNDVSTLYIAVGRSVYYLSQSGAWVWKYTHTEDVNSFTIDARESNYGDLYVISESIITKISSTTEDKIIYLRLIDKAGNESNLYYESGDNQGQIKPEFMDSISIENLYDFVAENKLFELNEAGSTVFSLRGNSSFYAGNKIEEEKGVYESEIFNGTNDLVKWESISWQATQPSDTQVLVYVRTSTSRNDILLEKWIGSFTNDMAGGVELSAYSGQFIQFKVELISQSKGITPTFYRASIRAVTSEAVHFFTTNFTLPSKLTKGIITSQKIIPVSADIVFALNTSNSVDWTDYTIVDENRLFNINAVNKNLRVGIKFITPSRTLYEAIEFGEYGPYLTSLFVNTIDFDFANSTDQTRDFSFKVTLYSDYALTLPICSFYSHENQDGFSIDGDPISANGYEIDSGEEIRVLFTVPGYANINCNEYYFIGVQSTWNGTTFSNILTQYAFITGCSTTFVDIIDFDFINETAIVQDYHFRIRFYEDPERTIEYLTVFSGNNTEGWFVNDVKISANGATVNPEDSINIVYRPSLDSFTANKTYYLRIEAHDQSQYILASNSYTFQARDITSLVYCGGYEDVPIVKNFGIMFELENKELLTLNL